MLEEEKFFTVKEFAELLNLTQVRLRALLRQGKIAAVKFGDAGQCHWRIPRNEYYRMKANAMDNIDLDNI